MAVVENGVPEARTTFYDAAGTGTRMLVAGWPDERSVRASLIDPIDPIEITRFFEDIAKGQET